MKLFSNTPKRFYSTNTPRGALNGLGDFLDDFAPPADPIIPDVAGVFDPLADLPLATDYVIPAGDVPVYDAAGNVIGSEPARPLTGEIPGFYANPGQPVEGEVVSAQAGEGKDTAASRASAGMQPGQTRTVVNPDGTTQIIRALASAPSSPEVGILYKVGEALLRYIAQPVAGGGTRLTPVPVTASAAPSMTTLALLGLGAYLLLS